MIEEMPTPEELKQLQREEAIVTSLGRQQRREQQEEFYGTVQRNGFTRHKDMTP